MCIRDSILSDANDYGIQVIFHGCTLPRGWERMYPNYVSVSYTHLDVYKRQLLFLSLAAKIRLIFDSCKFLEIKKM